MNLEEYKAVIKPLLSEKRYHHSICVAKAAKELAKKYGADVQKAETAGILHDIMKDIPPEEQLEKMEQYGIRLTPVERAAPKLWHAMLGAAYLKEELHLEDSEILDAVRYHTTGRTDMTLMDKILFIADFISDDRDYEGVEDLRKAAKISLEEAMTEGFSYTIGDLAKSRKPIHPDTIAAYNQTVLAYHGK
ncbi:MAG: bis(5'-nucleosyl)-tetraphosphatase (symmetrical) YqeK [Oscillospiraceae bacterium]|jgi:predicted HD superfamily hydrolase involved in NAD metabolism|nr:bis(5'-nucleosyl)-tetraphosphatase (symmetrical) YqeK [Oscillospiraceae bacterium]MCI1990661.1 bis(5'-nucleosyl)-tetraphosphatase (symmetrical) YqeK [Oscillospiraceae bacterium]MCI2035254.1 bis(5'-nucleosyl)-tetraphosphatase (symmetrical) YqeK [Oscillospiraceae bacterium]